MLQSAVREATSNYRKSMDMLGLFLEGECVKKDGYSVSKKALYAAYRGWCEANGERPMSQRRLSERLSETGIESTKTSAGHYWSNLGLLSDTVTQ